MKKFIPYLMLLAAVATLQSCKKDFLDRPPIDQYTSGNFYSTDQEVLAGTAPLYNIVWFDYNDKAFLAFGEARGGNLNSNDRTAYIRHAPSASDASALLPAYKSFYKIIAQSNITMQSITKSAQNVTPAIRNMGLGECRFMRAMGYYYLVMNWGAVPIVYDNIKQLGTPPVRNNIEDVWKFIIMDLRFAAENLPAVPQAQGRITKWSAEGMLAKAYLVRSGLGATAGARRQSDLDSAKYFSADVINNSGLSLFPTYSGLFRSATNNSSNNNPESLFSIQWMPFSQPWGVNNSFQAYMAFESAIPNTGDGWGAAQGVSADVVKYFIAHPEDSIRRKEICMFNADRYPELKQATGGLNYTVTSISNVKKYVIGSPADNGNKGGFMCAYINTYMLRLAEVYLIHAEAILGNSASTTDAAALASFNAVRTRAGVPTMSSITFTDIFQEKRVETIMEGSAWYEIVRWHYFNPVAAKAYVAAQDKGNYTVTYQANTSNPRQYTVAYTPEYYGVTDQTLYLPYPEAELVNAPSLSGPAVPFDFSLLQ
jgi:starch-binding outer membrane protein, SusD/RagB family